MFLAIAIFGGVWMVFALKFLYPYDKVLSELGREERFVFLYDEQRLVDEDELTDAVLKGDGRWRYGLAEDLEVMEVSFPQNKKVFFLTTSKGGRAPWERWSADKAPVLTARMLTLCLKAQECGGAILLDLGDTDDRVYARTQGAVKTSTAEWKATLDFAHVLVSAVVERQELRAAFIRYGMAVALPLMFFLLYWVMRKASRNDSGQ